MLDCRRRAPDAAQSSSFARQVVELDRNVVETVRLRPFVQESTEMVVALTGAAKLVDGGFDLTVEPVRVARGAHPASQSEQL
jgi:hypothetical protein